MAGLEQYGEWGWLGCVCMCVGGDEEKLKKRRRKAREESLTLSTSGAVLKSYGLVQCGSPIRPDRGDVMAPIVASDPHLSHTHTHTKFYRSALSERQ